MGPKAAATKKTVTKKAVAKVKPSHPTYQIMISHAIAELKERTGSSQPAIIKYIEANYNVSQDTFKTQLKMAFKRLLEKGILEKVKASYKLTEAGRNEHKAEAGVKKVTAVAKPKADVAAPPKVVAKKAPAKPTPSASKATASKKNAAKPTSTVAKKPAAPSSKKPAAKKPAASNAKKPAAKK